MENQNNSTDRQKGDELDLGQLFKFIGDGFYNLFKGFLRIFVYLRKNIVILLLLILLGLGLGIVVNKWVPEKLKTEVIVKPNLDSKDYLYDVISEINSNIQAKDTAFFGSLGLDMLNITGLEVLVEPVEFKQRTKDDLKYLEILQKFENSGYVEDIVRERMREQGTFYHRIYFLFPEAGSGNESAIKLMDYINSNLFFSELAKIERDNRHYRIKQDEAMLKQIDDLIALYSKQLDGETIDNRETRITFSSDEESGIADLIEQKNRIIRDLEEKKVEIKHLETPVSIINFGSPQAIQKSFFGKNIVFFPSVFILGFLLTDLLKYLNRRSRELQL